MQIGKRIKELRKVRGISLTDLSSISGVQLATLSRMENLKMVGTLESHLKIAKALGVDITEFYSGITLESKKIELITEKAAKEAFIHNEKASFEMLTTRALSKKMMPILIKLEPGGQSPAEQNRPETEKFTYVLEGQVELKVGNEVYPLSKGNSLYFDASLSHNFFNRGKAPARVLCIITPPAL